jgi:hypothetical protein
MTKQYVILGILSLTVAFGAGCGSSDGFGREEDFVGTWQYTSGTRTTTCAGQSQTEIATGNLALSTGISSDLVMVDETCSLRFDIIGNTASLIPGQSCNAISNGSSMSIAFTALTITVDALIADMSRSATITVAGPTGTIACTYTETAKLQKISK